MSKVIRYLSLGLIVGGILSTTPVLAQTTYYVSADCGNNAWSGLTPDCAPNDGPKSTIGAAINAAVSSDTILVAPGTYLENLVFGGREIVISSTEGPETTIIDGSARSESVVRLVDEEGSETVLNGFTLINGTGSGTADVQFGGAVSCKNSFPTLSNNIMHDNSADFGGAIDADGGSLRIIGNVFFDNVATDCDADHLCGNGGAINLFNATAVIENNVMIDNTALLNGGGLAIEITLVLGEFDILCRNNLIVENTAERHGGGIYQIFRGSLLIQGTTISRNLSSEGGDGFYIGGNGGATADIRNSILYGNGGGDNEIMLADGEIRVRYSDILNGQGGVHQTGGTLVWEAGNVSSDPEFVDPPQSDYHLQECSAAINAGDPAYNPDPDETDIDGEQRVLGVAIDMGADEVPHVDVNGNGIPDGCECDPCDMNCDGDVNALDIEPFLELLFAGGKRCALCTGDVNGDGMIDALDIEPFLSCLFP